VPAITHPREPVAENLPAEERLRQSVYDLYVEHGNGYGSELDDWIQAEEEILLAAEQQGA
jgi:hypothetical protein